MPAQVGQQQAVAAAAAGHRWLRVCSGFRLCCCHSSSCCSPIFSRDNDAAHARTALLGTCSQASFWQKLPVGNKVHFPPFWCLSSLLQAYVSITVVPRTFWRQSTFPRTDSRSSSGFCLKKLSLRNPHTNHCSLLLGMNKHQPTKNIAHCRRPRLELEQIFYLQENKSMETTHWQECRTGLTSKHVFRPTKKSTVVRVARVISHAHMYKLNFLRTGHVQPKLG